MAQCFNQAVTVAAFYGNRAAYAKKCINKYRPQLHCNGQCQLMKKLRVQEKQDQQTPERKLENKANVFSAKNFYEINIAAISTNLIHNTEYLKGTCINVSYPSFHPPQC